MRYIEQKWVDDRLYIEASGDSGDSKPTTNICDGSIFLESDTGTVFFFNEDSGDWVEQFSFQPGS